MQVSTTRRGRRALATPDDDEAVELAALFRLLGDPTRVRILYALLAHGELSVGALARDVGASDTKVSQALRLLRSTGVVRNRRDGRTIHYRLDDEHVRTLLDVSRDHLAHHLAHHRARHRTGT